VTLTPEFLLAAHAHSSVHRDEVMASAACGCFYCQATFAPADIKDWVEEITDDQSKARELWTALCPKCGIDSVIGNASPFPATDPEFLRAMNELW
jgi:hypothetical protein